MNSGFVNDMKTPMLRTVSCARVGEGEMLGCKGNPLLYGVTYVASSALGASGETPVGNPQLGDAGEFGGVAG